MDPDPKWIWAAIGRLEKRVKDLEDRQREALHG